MNNKKVLIANRGEIAARILGTCQELGYETVVIYSDADQHLPYVEQATEAVHIGPAPVSASYLQAEKIVQVAVDHGVDMVHPGYGLLAENAHFARQVEQANMTFIGPSATVIEQMGDKIKARQLMQEAGVPVVPGTQHPLNDEQEALQQAAAIGYPLLLKASSGGGGIGMHICYSAGDVEKNFAAAKKRAKATFGQDDIYLEKYIENPRHIEVQIMADAYGQVCHMFERNCSVQRRHQKVIEESPALHILEETKQAMYHTAVTAAQAIDYVGAGTIEFIMDDNEQFYFLEMNTRLQVEHPVTEEVTGQDLVALQLAVAEGQELPFTQSELRQQGHAIEMRIYAEDPHTFMPSPGKITAFEKIQLEGVRFDDSIKEGLEVTPYYDPLIAKCIVSANNREGAIKKAIHALTVIRLEGIKHNIPFMLRVLSDERFNDGNYTTHIASLIQEKQHKG